MNLIKYYSVTIALILSLILLTPVMASGADATSVSCEEINSLPKMKSILRVTANAVEAKESKAKKKVSWVDDLRENTAVSTLKKVLEGPEAPPKKTAALVPKKSRPYNPQSLNSAAESYVQRALQIYGQGEPYVFSGSKRELKEVSAGHLCFMAARLYLVTISALEQEKMRNENLCRPLDAGKNDPAMLARMQEVWSQFTPDMYSNNLRAYKGAINIGTQMFYSALLKTSDLEEFHAIGLRLVKLFYTQIQLGLRGEVIRRVKDIDLIIHQRMENLHVNSKYARQVERMIQRVHGACEREIQGWQTKIDEIKKSKGRKAHKAARLLHARNMLAATQQEQRDIYKRNSKWMKLRANVPKSYADEHKHGCEYCIPFLHALDQIMERQGYNE
jgi:hypothetical protein